MRFLSKIFGQKDEKMDDLDKELMKLKEQEKVREKNKKAVDDYFDAGEKAQSLWRAGNKVAALKYANQQIDWYRYDTNRSKLKLDLADVLPKKLLGLDIVIRGLREDAQFDEAIELVEEFRQITDKDSLYNDDLIRRINKKRK